MIIGPRMTRAWMAPRLLTERPTTKRVDNASFDGDPFSRGEVRPRRPGRVGAHERSAGFDDDGGRFDDRGCAVAGFEVDLPLSSSRSLGSGAGRGLGCDVDQLAVAEPVHRPDGDAVPDDPLIRFEMQRMCALVEIDRDLRLGWVGVIDERARELQRRQRREQERDREHDPEIEQVHQPVQRIPSAILASSRSRAGLNTHGRLISAAPGGVSSAGALDTPTSTLPPALASTFSPVRVAATY